MNLRPTPTLLAFASLVLAQAAMAATVTYVNPENMTDIPRHQGEREAMEKIFTEHLATLEARLPKGQQLTVEVLDIDLAGDVFPRVAIQNVRVMKDTGDRPAMQLRYRIEQDGTVVSQGESQLSSFGYLSTSNRYGSDLYAHEKQMLDNWFRKDVLAGR
jgi:hypothetical protein